MENNQKPSEQKINIYAVFGIALSTSILVTLFFLGFGALIFGSDGVSSPFGPALFISLTLASIGASIGIPILKAHKHGWRTMVTTIVVQLVLQFLVLLIASIILTAMFSSSSSGDYQYGSRSSPNDVVIGY